ncbi:hypothetical protein CERZMDRAFT_80595 [Cercospora zeae-maydis SCOH1-5]|uniref:Extracellular mutant protein 11 C-terminal domain-containing protein n=1 Tax=Cercospora zeae-maydis SCOH1-5 TaxID=717836 RepID=A0A6A6FX38_9PEZI|nr:hypothetical protein CERZMDRAFT_80595 [Cercospora zeae-maydis SCOH1-5]
MSQAKTSGLKQFVHRGAVAQYDGPDDGKPKRKSSKGKSAEELKVRNSDVTEARVQANSQKARDGVQISAPRTRSQARHDRAVYDDTDASNADLESASASTQPTKHNNARQQHVSIAMQDPDHRENEAIGSDVGEDAVQVHGENAAGAARQGQNGGNPNAFAQHIIKGDSFPSTTSGRPSEVDLNEVISTQPGHHPRSHLVHAPTRGVTRAQGGVTARTFHQPQTTTPLQPVLGDPNLDGGNPWSKPSNTQPAVKFTFGPGPRLPQPQGVPHAHTSPLNPYNQPHATNQRVSFTNNERRAANHQAQINHDQRPVANYQASVNAPVQGPHPPATILSAEKQNDTRLSAKRHPSQEPPQPPDETGHGSEITDDAHNLTPSPRLNPNAMQNSRRTRYEQPSQPDMPSGSDHQPPQSADENEMDDQHYGGDAEGGVAEHYPQDAQPEDEPIDHERNDLFQMSYSQLKAESFDIDPRKKLELPPEWQARTLHEKLQSVMPLDGETQAHFFENLSIDEWEDAGDWFLERFGDIVRRLKESRRHKRRVASAFEDKIEQRSEAVSKKQKLTQGALDEMRESGGKVLQRTPKKSRKPKK